MEDHKKTTESVIHDGRRGHQRVPGPFDGSRTGPLETPVRICDLSEGGCFVNSPQEQEPGVLFRLKIELPDEGWITVKAESLYLKPGIGFAVRFTEIPEESMTRLRRALERLRDSDSSDG